MLSNVALDVFIGLVFVFLLYSLLATVIQEIISSFLNLRAVVLVKAMRIMLNDRPAIILKNTSTIGKAWERFVISLETQWQYISCLLPDQSLAKAFYKHPAIKYLSPSISRSKPSYIEPKNFSSVLIQILRGKNFNGSMPSMLCIYNTLFPMITANQHPANTTQVEVGQVNPVSATIQPETLDHLRQLYIDARHDINTFESSLEDWFDQTMDRANGWYKRQTRRILFFLGLFIAIWGNVDTIKIYHILSKDKNARDQMVQMAVESQKKYEAIVQPVKSSGAIGKRDSATYQNLQAFISNDSLLYQTYNDVKEDVDQSNYILAMGWHKSQKYKAYDSMETLQQTIRDSLQKTPEDSALQKRAALLQSQITVLQPLVYDKFDWSSSLLGWLLTALALTLGAPFWFDLLSKFISLRATGKKPVVDNDDVSKPTDIILPAQSIVPPIPAQTIVPHVSHTNNFQPEIVPDEAGDTTLPQG